MIKSKFNILLVSVVMILIMALVEIFLKPTYIIKSLIKIMCFAVIPIILAFLNKKINVKSFLSFSKKSIFIALAFGLLIYLVILGSYFILNNFIDFSSIVVSLEDTLGINKSNFIFVAMYISFINSFLEEFFFRGFCFTNLKNNFNRTDAYIISSVLFSLYHVAIMNSWFNVWITVLALLGLFVGGVIFNYFNEKENNIYISWLIHMFSNFGINTVGFILLGII